MTLILDNHSFSYEMENLCRVFFPYHKIQVSNHNVDDDIVVYTGIQNRDGYAELTVCVTLADNKQSASGRVSTDMPGFEDECERMLAVLLYGILSQMLSYRPAWGILTGVRPIKLIRRLTQAEGEQSASAYFTDKLLVSREKTELSVVTMKHEQKILSLSSPESFSLYISIPFCPSRCAYCSFVSQSVEQAKKLMPQYVELLCREIESTGEIAKRLRLKLETVYIGGGTPTTLSPEQLTLVMQAIRSSFDLSSCREYTVEAGRPDTITQEKLQAILAGGSTRISINPQTLNDEVLHRIGRRHTAGEAIEAFHLARVCGCDNINMDLIAGLPGDSIQSFQETLNEILRLSPECITIHTLAMKRSSALTQENAMASVREGMDAAAMLDYAGSALPQNRYIPYYLYRQSRMVGNLENVGWSKPGYEGLYNVFVMDETHTILACGAGAVTKLKEPHGDKIERIFNFKYPYEYVSRFEQMLTRKERVCEFYE